MKSLWLLGILCFTFAAQGKTQIVYLEKNESCQGRFCVRGTFTKKTPLLLISLETEKTCLAKTGTAQTDPFPFSELTNVKKCDLDNITYELGVFDMDSVSVKKINGKKMTGARLKDATFSFHKDAALTAAVKAEKIFPNGKKDMIPYTVADLRRKDLEAFSYKVGKEELQIVRPLFGDGTSAWSYFAHFHGKWSRVASGFTSERRPLVFTLRNRVFIESEVTCQTPCAKMSLELNEFNGRIFRKVQNKD